jgi:hypothetical protein
MAATAAAATAIPSQAHEHAHSQASGAVRAASAVMIGGVPTDLIACRYDDALVLFASQGGAVGTVLRAR